MIYLDYAATSFKKPPEVQNAVISAMREFSANPGRGGHKLALKASLKVYEARETLADMFNAQPQNVVFTKNATEALNIAIKGLAKKGGHIVVSGMEHNSVYRPVYALGSLGIGHSIAKVSLTDDGATLGAFATALKDNTCAVVCTAASNVCGLLLPVEKIAGLCREKKIPFIIDAAQTAGLYKYDIKKLHAAAICFAGHKGLYGPQGSGALICGADGSFQTVMEGGSGSDSFSREMPETLPERLEYGTLNVPAIAGLSAGAKFIMKHREELLLNELFYADMIEEGLRELGAKIVGRTPSKNAPVVSFLSSKLDSESAAYEFDAKNIALRAGWHCAPLAHKSLGTEKTGTIRASVGAFTKKSEIGKFLSAARGIV